MTAAGAARRRAANRVPASKARISSPCRIVVEGHPLIEWLILEGKASFLKQFFDVSMVIQNLSPEPFDLTAGQATLNLPPGLTLAPTPEPQHAHRTRSRAIPGGGSAERRLDRTRR